MYCQNILATKLLSKYIYKNLKMLIFNKGITPAVHARLPLSSRVPAISYRCSSSKILYSSHIRHQTDPVLWTWKKCEIKCCHEYCHTNNCNSSNSSNIAEYITIGSSFAVLFNHFNLPDGMYRDILCAGDDIGYSVSVNMCFG
jgi:hypothetical protein